MKRMSTSHKRSLAVSAILVAVLVTAFSGLTALPACSTPLTLTLRPSILSLPSTYHFTACG